MKSSGSSRIVCSPHEDAVHRLYKGYRLLKPETEDGLYQPVHNCVDIRDEIPPSLPCLPAGRLYKREEFPSLAERG